MWGGDGKVSINADTKLKSQVQPNDNIDTQIDDMEINKDGKKGKDGKNDDAEELDLTENDKLAYLEALDMKKDMTLLESLWKITTLATPAVLGLLLYLLVQMSNTFFIGNLNEPILLGGVGMGNMLINVLCFAIVQGLNSALFTFE